MNRTSYNNIAREWNAARTGFYGRERDYLDALLLGVPAGSSILDLGCGTGRPLAEYAISRGYRIIGVDQAEHLLALAREAFPTEEWILSSIEAYEFDRPYSCAIVWDALFHIVRTEHECILNRLIDGLPAGGRLMLTVGGSEHPAFTDFMFGHEFFYDSNTPQQTERIMVHLGCRIVIAEYMNRPTGQRDKGRYAIVAEKV